MVSQAWRGRSQAGDDADDSPRGSSTGGGSLGLNGDSDIHFTYASGSSSNFCVQDVGSASNEELLWRLVYSGSVPRKPRKHLRERHMSGLVFDAGEPNEASRFAPTRTGEWVSLATGSQVKEDCNAVGRPTSGSVNMSSPGSNIDANEVVLQYLLAPSDRLGQKSQGECIRVLRTDEPAVPKRATG